MKIKWFKLIQRYVWWVEDQLQELMILFDGSLKTTIRLNSKFIEGRNNFQLTWTTSIMPKSVLIKSRKHFWRQRISSRQERKSSLTMDFSTGIFSIRTTWAERSLEDIIYDGYIKYIRWVSDIWVFGHGNRVVVSRHCFEIRILKEIIFALTEISISSCL